MGWSGYEEHLCANGHRFQDESLAFSGEVIPKCYHCGADSVWYIVIDQTNGPSQGIITEEGWKTLEISPEEIETCPTCSHSKISKQAVYRIPSQKEEKALRQYFDE